MSQKQPDGEVARFTLTPYGLPAMAAKLWHAASVLTEKKLCGHASVFSSVPTNAAQDGPPRLRLRQSGTMGYHDGGTKGSG